MTKVRDLASNTEGQMSESHVGPYCVVALLWLQQWDEETKDKVLLDAKILNGGTFRNILLFNYQLSYSL